jgi:hypothetical protein
MVYKHRGMWFGCEVVKKLHITYTSLTYLTSVKVIF